MSCSFVESRTWPRRRPHRLLGLTAVLLLAPAFALAGARTWTNETFPIANTDWLEFRPVIVPDQTGGAIVAWTRQESTYVRAYAVRIDSRGNPLPGWTTGGRLVADRARDPFLAVDGSGGAFLALAPPGSVSLVHIPQSGELALASPPVSKQPATSTHSVDGTWLPGVDRIEHEGLILPWVIPDGSGGGFMTHEYEGRLHDHLYVRRYASDGAFVEVELPGSCGSYYCDGRTPVLCPDGSGGVFLAKVDGGARLTRMASDLTPPIDWQGDVVTDSLGVFVGIAEDGMGGAYVASQRWRPTFDLRLQHVDARGIVASGWPQDGVVISPFHTVPGDIRLYYDSYCSIVPDGSGGALVAWSDQRADTGDVYVQRILPDGSVALGWSPNGVPAGVARGLQQSPVLVADGEGGAIVTWEDQRGDPDYGIYYQHVHASGVPEHGLAGAPIGTGPSFRLAPRIATDGAGGAFVTWADKRRDNWDIQAAHLGFEDVDAPAAPTGLAAAESSGGIALHWNRDLAPDLAGYRLHRTESEDFIPSEGNRIASLTDTAMVDPGGGLFSVYELVAVDLRGHVSPFASVTVLPRSRVTLASTRAEAAPDHVLLEWLGVSLAGREVAVFRSDAADWRRLGTAVVDGEGRLEFEDVSPPSGTRVGYRVAFTSGPTTVELGQVWVHVPHFQLGLGGVRPNPTSGGSISVWLTLPRGQPSILDLLDVSGRRLARLELDDRRPGTQLVRLDSGRRLAAGVYLVRLTSGLLTKTARFCVLN